MNAADARPRGTRVTFNADEGLMAAERRGAMREPGIPVGCGFGRSLYPGVCAAQSAGAGGSGSSSQPASGAG